MRLAEQYRQKATEIRRLGGGPFNEAALDTKELVRLATLAASSHNTQPWKFRIGSDSVTVLPDFRRRCPVVDPDDSHLFKSIGCAAENLVHAAAAQGFDAQVSFHPAEEGVVVRLERSRSAHANDLFRAIPARQCTRTAYDGSSLAYGQLKLLEEAGRGEGVRTLMLTNRKQLEAVKEYVTDGDRAQLTDPAFREELSSWIRFNPGEALRTGDGLSNSATGQPALPRWLAKPVLPFVLTAKGQSEKDAEHIDSSSAIAVFVVTRDEKPAWIEVGRAYERFALQAAALTIRTAFVNQPVEVRRLRPQFESWLGMRGETAMLIARLGRASLAPYSLRRPVDEVIVH